MTRWAHIAAEQIRFDYSETEVSNAEYSLHCHNFYELYYFINGDVDYLVEGRHYHPTPHSLLLLAPNIFHGVRINSAAPYRRYSFHFHPDCLSAERRGPLLSLFPGPEDAGRLIYFEHLDEQQVPAFFDALAQCSHEPEDTKNALLPILAEALLSKLLMVCRTDSHYLSAPASSSTVGNILTYLNEHMARHISLDEISQKFYISKHHLNKVFRSATGTTVGDYLLHKRVAHAQMMLLAGHSAADASSASGFSDYSAFFRAYKRITGHSPLQDRGGAPFQQRPGNRMQVIAAPGTELP